MKNNHEIILQPKVTFENDIQLWKPYESNKNKGVYCPFSAMRAKF